MAHPLAYPSTCCCCSACSPHPISAVSVGSQHGSPRSRLSLHSPRCLGRAPPPRRPIRFHRRALRPRPGRPLRPPSSGHSLGRSPTASPPTSVGGPSSPTIPDAPSRSLPLPRPTMAMPPRRVPDGRWRGMLCKPRGPQDPLHGITQTS